MTRAIGSFAARLALAILSACASKEAASAGGITPDSGSGSEDVAGPLQGTLYAPACRFVATYCAGCHWKDGKDPKQKVAYPAFHVDTYADWTAGHTILLAVLDKWHPDGDVMPPPDAVEPPDDDRRSMLDWIRRDAPNTVDGK